MAETKKKNLQAFLDSEETREKGPETVSSEKSKTSDLTGNGRDQGDSATTIYFSKLKEDYIVYKNCKDTEEKERLRKYIIKELATNLVPMVVDSISEDDIIDEDKYHYRKKKTDPEDLPEDEPEDEQEKEEEKNHQDELEKTLKEIAKKEKNELAELEKNARKEMKHATKEECYRILRRLNEEKERICRIAEKDRRMVKKTPKNRFMTRQESKAYAMQVLMEKFDEYDLCKGVAINTYFTNTVKYAIKDEQRERRKTETLRSRWDNERFSHIAKLSDEYWEKVLCGAIDPAVTTEDDYLKENGISERILLNNAMSVQGVVSLDAPVSGRDTDDERTIADEVADETEDERAVNAESPTKDVLSNIYDRYYTEDEILYLYDKEKSDSVYEKKLGTSILRREAYVHDVFDSLGIGADNFYQVEKEKTEIITRLF